MIIHPYRENVKVYLDPSSSLSNCSSSPINDLNCLKINKYIKKITI